MSSSCLDCVDSAATDPPSPLRRSGSTALHDQLAEWLRDLVAGLPVDTKLPAEHDLMAAHGVSRSTVRRAIKALVEDGRLVARQGMGTFVGATPVVQSMNFFRPFVDSIYAEGSQQSELLGEQWLTVGSTPSVFGGSGQRGYGFSWLYRVDGRPHALLDGVLPQRLGQQLMPEGIQETPVYYLLRDRLGLVLQGAEYTISACVADRRLSEVLEVQPGKPLLVMRRSTRDRSDEVVEVSTHYLAPDTHRLQLNLQDDALAPLLDLHVQTQ